MSPETASVDVVILGSAGYGGGELLRLVAGHPAVASLTPVSRSQAGQPVTAVHQHLHNLETLRFAPWPVWAELEGVSPLVVFSAMSHGELATVFSELQPQLAALAAQRQLVFIDLSADFRLDGSDRYEKYYGHSHACPQYLSAFVFGLPELNRTALRQAQWIACPGCIATAICLTLLPLHSVDGLGLIAVASSTGSSGSGIHPSRTTHHPGRAQDFRTYNTLHHRHQGEAELVMEAGGARGYVLSLVPQSAPLVRGIFVAMQCLLPPQLDGAQAQALFLQRYAGEPFVRVVERSPRVAVVAGSNYAEIGVTVHDGRLAVCCALDNLGKGMAGTAIHNMNLALGLPETTGLAQAGVYP